MLIVTLLIGYMLEPTPALSVIGRTIDQDQGGWIINYQLQYRGKQTITIAPANVSMRVEGWVSNSRVAAHSIPHWSSLIMSRTTDLTGIVNIITSTDETKRCREKATIQIKTEGQDSEPTAPIDIAKDEHQPLTVKPGETVRARIKLEHMHVLYGDYDPLLGTRTLECQLGPVSFHDALPLDREQYLAQPLVTWPSPPEDRRDTGLYLSAPDSLHLEAHVPGNQYYRFPERPVRYATRMRLRFWYFIAAGTEGECRAHIAQYKDTPTAWKVLSEGGHEQPLNVVGRWVKVERVFRTEPDATTLALDFRISSPCEVGEMWVDDVTLDPVGAHVRTGP